MGLAMATSLSRARFFRWRAALFPEQMAGCFGRRELHRRTLLERPGCLFIRQHPTTCSAVSTGAGVTSLTVLMLAASAWSTWLGDQAAASGGGFNKRLTPAAGGHFEGIAQATPYRGVRASVSGTLFLPGLG